MNHYSAGEIVSLAQSFSNPVSAGALTNFQPIYKQNMAVGIILQFSSARRPQERSNRFIFQILESKLNFPLNCWGHSQGVFIW